MGGRFIAGAEMGDDHGDNVMDMAIPVVYADGAVLVADKPAGLLSVPGRGQALRDCLLARLQGRFPGARIVHRLDRDTSGLIVLALDGASHRDLSGQFHDRQVDKQYEAIVAGAVEGDAGVIDLPMRKDLEHPPRHRVDVEHGRWAVTTWRVLDRGLDRTRMALQPLTGRSHQLRVHLSAMGHAVLGDPLYGRAGDPPSQRLMLHATRIAFRHPYSGRRVECQSSCPF